MKTMLQNEDKGQITSNETNAADQNEQQEQQPQNQEEQLELNKEIQKEKPKRKTRLTSKKESSKDSDMTELNEMTEQIKSLLDDLQPEKLIEDITTTCMENIKDLQKETITQIKSDMKILNRESRKLKFMEAMAEVHKNLPKITPNRTVKKESNSNNYNSEYTYADLTTVVEHTRNILSAEGLFVEFRHKISKDNSLKIKCLVHHKDGYTYKSETMKIPVNINDVQNITSTITYMKRYLYNSMFNLTTEYDDDGTKAAKKTATITPKEPKKEEIPNKETSLKPKAENQGLNATHNQNPFPNKFNPNTNKPNQNPPKKTITPDIPQETNHNFRCADCNTEISEEEFNFSVFAFKKPYCIECQKNHKN